MGEYYGLVEIDNKVVDEDILIWFVDTISDANIKQLKTTRADGVIYVNEVEDPRRFGVVVTKKACKQYRVVFDKRVLHGYCSVPYGY